jgi:hypothetical protein
VRRREPLVPAKALTVGKRVHAALAGEPLPDDATPAERAMVDGYRARWRDDKIVFLQHEIPFSFRLYPKNVRVSGVIDALAREGQDGDIVLVERKTTSQEISPGSAYWRRITSVDAQVSVYLLAARELRLHARKLVYDVIRKPALRERKGEPPEEFYARILEDMAARPEWYFQRAEIVRLEHEHEDFTRDIIGTVAMMRKAPRPAPRNTDACFAFGRECDFFGVCAGNISIDDNTRFKDKERT